MPSNSARIVTASYTTRWDTTLIAYAERTAVEKLSFGSVESIYLPLSENLADVHAVLAATVFGGEAPTRKNDSEESVRV
jgi:hypothetical protein